MLNTEVQDGKIWSLLSAKIENMVCVRLSKNRIILLPFVQTTEKLLSGISILLRSVMTANASNRLAIWAYHIAHVGNVRCSIYQQLHDIPCATHGCQMESCPLVLKSHNNGIEDKRMNTNTKCRWCARVWTELHNVAYIRDTYIVNRSDILCAALIDRKQSPDDFRIAFHCRNV